MTENWAEMTHTKGWKVGKPRKFHTQRYIPIRHPVMEEVLTDVCWVLDADEVSLIAAAPEQYEFLVSIKALVYSFADEETKAEYDAIIAKVGGIQ